MLGGSDGEKCGWCCCSPWGLLPNVKHKQSSGQCLGGDSLEQHRGTGGMGLSAACTQFWRCKDFGDRGFSASEPSFLSELWSSVFLTFKNSWHRKSSRSAYLIKEWKCGCFSFFSTLVRNEWGNSWQGWVLWWGSLTSFIHWDEQIPAATKGGSFQGMQTCRGRASFPCSQLPKEPAGVQQLPTPSTHNCELLLPRHFLFITTG